jgi:opacity protein-like surface antigen
MMMPHLYSTADLNMKKTTAIVASIASLLFCGAAAAQDFAMRPYVGADALFWDFDADGLSSFSATGLRLRGGVYFNQYFALEAHAGFGGSDSKTFSDGFGSVGIEVELDRFFSAFLRGTLPLGDRFNAYGLLGYTDAKASLTVSDGPFSFSESDSDNGLSFGIGADMAVMNNVSLNLDYVRYLDASDYEFSGISFGVRYVF